MHTATKIKVNIVHHNHSHLPGWQEAERERLEKEHRFYEMSTRRICPNHDCGAVWHTYESDGCPECSSNRRERD